MSTSTTPSGIKRKIGKFTLGEIYTQTQVEKTGVAVILQIGQHSKPQVQLDYLDHRGNVKAFGAYLLELVDEAGKPAEIDEKDLKTGDIVFGQKYEDTTMRFIGTAISYGIHLTGCNRVLLEYKDGEGDIKNIWIDETRLMHCDTGKQVQPAIKAPGPVDNVLASRP